MTDQTEKKRPGLMGRLFGSKAASEALPSAGQSSDSSTDAEVEAPSAPAADAAPEEVPPTEEPKSWFQRLKSGLTRTSSKLSDGITGLFKAQAGWRDA